jgi:hypothetical protein
LVLRKLFWSNTSDLKKLQLIENFAARIITARESLTITPHLQELTWLPVSDQLLYSDLLLTFINASITWPLTSFVLNYLLVPAFTTAKHGINKNGLYIPIFKTCAGREPLNIEQQNFGTI